MAETRRKFGQDFREGAVREQHRIPHTVSCRALGRVPRRLRPAFHLPVDGQTGVRAFRGTPDGIKKSPGEGSACFFSGRGNSAAG